MYGIDGALPKGDYHARVLVARAFSGLSAWPLWSTKDDERRRASVSNLIASHAREARELDAALRAIERAPTREDLTRIDTISQVFVNELRARPVDHSLAARFAHRMDCVLRTDQTELLDKDWLPSPIKRNGMRLLEHINQRIGAYELWSREVVVALEGLPRANIHELASGLGGFAIHLATNAPSGTSWTVCGSDLNDTYIEAANKRATGIPGLHFEHRDAADLRGVAGVDLFVCAQAAHHLTSGQIVRMISSALRNSPRGILVIDLARGVLEAIGVGAGLGLLVPMPLVVLDGVTSVRRAYTVPELELLARIAGAGVVRTKPIGPTHYALHALLE